MSFDSKQARKDCNGFRGRFLYDVERGDLAHIRKECDDRTCDCEVKTNADGDQDCLVCIGDMDHGADTGEPIARMLNTLPAALDEIRRLSTLVLEACVLAVDGWNQVESMPATRTAMLERLAAIRDSAGGNDGQH